MDDGRDTWRAGRIVGLSLASIGLASFGLAGGLTVAWDVSGTTGAEEASAHGPAGLIEDPSCDDLPDREDHVGVSATGGTGQAATVGVARTTLLRLDDRGRVLAAWSNTGCAPRPTDEVYVERPGGGIELASGPVVVGHRWTGDFTDPGVFVAQRLEP